MQSHKSRAVCGGERNGLKTASCGVDVLLFCIAAPEHFPWALCYYRGLSRNKRDKAQAPCFISLTLAFTPVGHKADVLTGNLALTHQIAPDMFYG